MYFTLKLLWTYPFWSEQPQKQISQNEEIESFQGHSVVLLIRRCFVATLSEQLAHSAVDLRLKEISEFLHGSKMNKNPTLPYAVQQLHPSQPPNQHGTIWAVTFTAEWADCFWECMPTRPQNDHRIRNVREVTTFSIHQNEKWHQVDKITFYFNVSFFTKMFVS